MRRMTGAIAVLVALTFGAGAAFAQDAAAGRGGGGQGRGGGGGRGGGAPPLLLTTTAFEDGGIIRPSSPGRWASRPS
jgi:hypothetical protein